TVMPYGQRSLLEPARPPAGGAGAGDLAFPGPSRRIAHLTVLPGGQASTGAGRAPPPHAARAPGITWIPLGNGEWAAAPPPGGSRPEAPARVTDLVRTLGLHTTGHGAAVVRVPSGMADRRVGLAVVQHRREGPVLYCAAEHIEEPAAAALADLAGALFGARPGPARARPRPRSGPGARPEHGPPAA